jgi:hypothetical protein
MLPQPLLLSPPLPVHFTMNRGLILALVVSLVTASVGTSAVDIGCGKSRCPKKPMRGSRVLARIISFRRNVPGPVTLTGLDLIDSNTEKRIVTLTNKQVIVVNQIPGMATPSFNINATIVGSGVKSVVFGYGSTTKYRTDNSAPFSFCGNNGPLYDTCTLLGLGTHVVTATPYSSAGKAGTPLKVTFSIVASALVAPATVATVAPRMPTRAPRAPTLAPKAPTPSPKVPSKAPMAPTPAPRAPTPAPRVPTPAPKTPTGVGSNYNIQIDLSRITTAADQAVFMSAAAKWESVIAGDLSSYDTRNWQARDDGCQWPSIIDDLFICAEYQTIDGPSNVLGYAGPEYIRNANGLPFSGSMVFDLDDIARLQSNGGERFLNTILHEMGHVLGT